MLAKRTPKAHRAIVAHANRLIALGLVHKLQTLGRASSHRDLHWSVLPAGRVIVLKNVGYSIGHGFNFERLRHSMLVLQNEIRRKQITPANYVLRSIKVYCRNDDFLIMKYARKARLAGNEKLFAAACKEIKGHFDDLLKSGKIQHSSDIPQVADAVFGGCTKNGKAIVYLPYDNITI